MKTKKRVMLSTLMKPAVEIAKERDMTFKELCFQLKRAWGKQTPREVEEAKEDRELAIRRASNSGRYEGEI